MRSFRGGVLSILMAMAVSIGSFPAGAAETPQASGNFKSKDVSFGVVGGLAFWSRSSDEGPRIELAVSNYEFVPAAFDAYYDPRPVIDQFFVDEKTAVVYFEFEPNGKYRGLSYMLGSGNGCAFCYDSGVKSTVQIKNQRLQGKLAFKDANRAFDIQVDVPVAPKDWGKPIAGEGGDVGAAYRAYNAAMDEGNAKKIVPLVDKHTRERFAKHEKDGSLSDYLDYRAEKVHWRIKEAHIVGGYVREKQAVLLVKASSTLLDHIHGQVTLTNEDGRWRISDEVYEVGE